MLLCIAFGIVTSWQTASLWEQFIGSVLAFFGLLVAYLRASHRGDTVWEQLREFGLRLFGKNPSPLAIASRGRDQIIRPAGAVLQYPLADLDGLTLQQQIEGLATYVRTRVNNRTQQLLQRVGALEVAIVDAQDAATETAHENYRRAKRDLARLQRELNQSAALDLRWAIFGIYIATIGLGLGLIPEHWLH